MKKKKASFTRKRQFDVLCIWEIHSLTDIIFLVMYCTTDKILQMFA